MNSRKREMQDRAVRGYEMTRVVRNHRAPLNYSIRRQVARVLAITAVIVVGVSPVAVLARTGGAETVPVRPAVAIAEPLPVPDPEASRGAPRDEPVNPPMAVRTPMQKERPVCLRCARINAVVNYALAQRGDPYRWASSGPNSYDCSGLVLAAYARIDIKLPHYTGWIISRGTRVSRANLQRGDIVFPESGHVGIYLGNGMLVHASSSKGGVVVGKLYSFYSARRVI